MNVMLLGLRRVFGIVARAAATSGLGAALLVLAGAGSAPAVARGVDACERTAQVRDALTAASGGQHCAGLTSGDLLEITALDLAGQGIASLRTGDFDGLVRLRTFDLSGNRLSALPPGLFDPLHLLKTLRLHGNQLESIPAEAFRQLFLLEELSLHGNRFASLPEGLFDELSRFDGFSATGGAPDNSGPHARLRRFLDRHGITSVTAFIDALPALHKERFVMVYRSEAIDAAAVTEEHPRIIAWGADARFVFSWPTNPELSESTANSVEFLQQTDERTWTAGLIDFSADAPAISQPEVCQSCHGALSKPLWGGYFVWGGTEGSYVASELEANKTNNYRAAYSSNPRITPLDFSASVFEFDYKRYFRVRPPAPHHHTGPVEEASLVLGLRHGEVLFKRLKARGDYAQFAADTLCGTDPAAAAQASFVESRDHSIGLFGNEFRSIAKFDSRITGVTHPQYNYQDADFGEILVFLMLHDLWQSHAGVRRAYRGVSNAELWDGEGVAMGAADHMVYPVGQANAEDELIQLYRLHFGYGSRASVQAIDNLQPTFMAGNFTARFGTGHLWTMLPRVCAALSDGSPQIHPVGPFRVPEGETAVAALRVLDAGPAALSWSLPSGADAGRFALSAQGALAFTGAKDFEAPDDANADGIYEVSVRVSDGDNEATADLRVALLDRNEAPAAAAAAEPASGVEAGATVTLAGTGTDPDAGDALSYAWTQTGGSAVALAAADTASASFTAPDVSSQEALSFRLRVTDAAGLYSEATVAVTVEPRQQRLTAQVEGVPNAHDGSAFSFKLRFSEEVSLSYKTLRDQSFAVTSARVASARRLRPPSNVGWDIEVSPASNADVGLALAANRACDAVGAICTEDGRPLSNRLDLNVPGPPEAPLTQRVEGMPESHAGAPFKFRLIFSEPVEIGYATLRDQSIEVTGGQVTRARRLVRFSNVGWEITVSPMADTDLSLVLRAGRSCDEAGAICTPDGRQLSNALEATVRAN